jgi:tetratricopeptide (TPR) repeat protein
MTQRLSCPQGHHWEIPDSQTDLPAVFPTHCPICGALPNTLMEKRIEQPAETPARDEDFPTTRVLPPDQPPAPVVARVAVEVPGYEVLGELGRGGAGVVYKARQVTLDRLVALKVLAIGPYAGAAERLRFQREAEAVARLRHPNIVQIHEVGESNGNPYLALEYLSGGNLAAKLAGQPQPPRQAAELLQTLARVIHFAHQQHILHRDLKPGNVLLDADGTPKVADFGLARQIVAGETLAAVRDRLTPTGAVLGTPSYMAPEQAGGATRQLGPAVDVYALGTILYEMLTGRPPFLGETLTDTLMQVLDAEPVPPRRLNPRTPRDLETICLKCLEKRPGARYASAAELADDLGRFLDGQPIQARPAGRLERALKWARRRPAQAALLIVSTFALLAAAAGITGHLIQLHDRNEALANALAAEERQRQRNVQLLRVTLEVQSDYGFYLDDQLKPLPHLTRLREQLLEKRLAFYQPILDQEPDDPVMRQTQGLAYLAVGVIRQRLARYDEAEKAYRAALERLDLPAEQASPASRAFLGKVCVQYGTLLNTQNRDDEAGRQLEEGERLLEQTVRDAPDDNNRQLLALACHNRAVFLTKKGELEAARQSYQRAIELRQELVKHHPSEDQYQRELAGSHVNLAALALRNQRPQQAREELARAATLLRRQPLDVDNRNLLAGVYHNLALAERRQAPQQALEDFQEALKRWSDLLVEFPAVADFRRQAASTHFLLGLQYEAVKRLPEARQALCQAVGLARESVGGASGAALHPRDLSQYLYHLGRLLRAAGQAEEAESLWREQRALLENVGREHPEWSWPHLDLSFVLGDLGDLDRVRGVLWWSRPPWPPAPTPLPLGAALHNLVGLSAGPAFLVRAADEYRQGLHEQRHVLTIGPPQPMHYTILKRHADFLALLAASRGNYEDMADAAAAEAQAARGLASEPDGGQRYRQAAGVMASCVRLSQRAVKLSTAEKDACGRRYAEQAVELLAEAVKAGFRDAANLERAPEFALIQSRPDFQKLLRELKKSRGAAIPR